jgi:hypothetical protein
VIAMPATSLDENYCLNSITYDEKSVALAAKFLEWLSQIHSVMKAQTALNWIQRIASESRT